MKSKLLKNNYSNSIKILNGSNLLGSSFRRIREFNEKEKIRIVIEGHSGNASLKEIYAREGIDSTTFYNWTQDFLLLENKGKLVNCHTTKRFYDDDRHRIVLEGMNGNCSIAEICKNENISQDMFLQWSDEFLGIRKKRLIREVAKDTHTIKIKELIQEFVGEEILSYFESYIDATSKETMVVKDHFDFSKKESLKNKTNLVCLSKINDVRNINKYFERVNSKLPKDGIFIGCLETLTERRKKIRKGGIPILNEFYFGIEFILKRVLPKLNITKRHYFNLTNGKNRLMSKAEGLGRLVSCGFKIMDYRNINGLTYFIVKKDTEPMYDMNPSYGPIYKMPRIGKNGRIIKVFKFRTMHPYSEYLQDYVLKTNGYAKSGKPADDFRIPTWGKFFRRFWLDEIPQLMNVLRGDMKLVGIRPVSKRYFQDIPKEMQKLRLTQKPGCIPPYVALNREGNVMSVLQAEREYLEEKLKKPYTTDTKYFIKAVFNIIVRNKRSA